MVQPPLFTGTVSSFRAMWKNPPGTDATPLLKSCAAALHGEFEETIRFLDHYCELLRLRIKYDVSLRSRYEDEGHDDWLKLQEHVNQDPTLTASLTVPTFEAIWAEVGALLHTINKGNPFADEYVSYISGEEKYHHVSLQRFEVLVFEELRAVPNLTDWIWTILSSQPRHFEMRMFASSKPGAKTIPPLTDAFQLYCFGEPHTPEYISYIGSLVVSMKRWLLCWDVIPDESELESFVESVVSEHQDLVSYPFSRHSIKVRRRLAQIDIRNATEILLANIIEVITSDDPRDYCLGLDWRIFKLFSHNLMEKATAQGSKIASEVQEVLMSSGLGEFVDPAAEPFVGWVDDTFENVHLPVLDDESNEEDDLSESDLEDLPDVCFEPVGPELKIENHAVAITKASEVAETNCPICIDVMDVHPTQRDEVPIKIECGHTFHYGCLSTLINGISKFSNLCPNCRYEICAGREKRLKNDDDLENALNEVTSTAETEDTEVVLQRDLQDNEGDVVMTDC